MDEVPAPVLQPRAFTASVSLLIFSGILESLSQKSVLLHSSDHPLLKRIEDIFYLILPPTEDEDEEPLSVSFPEIDESFFLLALHRTQFSTCLKIFQF